MTRRNFYEVLKEQKIDINKEYERLYEMFYNGEGYTIEEIIDKFFMGIWFRGTCCSLEEFNEEHDFYFDEFFHNKTIDDLIIFCEYIYNFVMAINSNSIVMQYVSTKPIIEQLNKVIEKVGYMGIDKDGLTIFILKSPQSKTVAEIVDKKLSYKILEYNHHSLKGDLESKKAILIQIADELEPQRAELKKIDTQLERDLFFAFNNFNIRHNNCDPKDTSKYVYEFATLANDKKEELYDLIYDQSLIAFLKLENKGRKEIFDDVKKKLDSKS